MSKTEDLNPEELVAVVGAIVFASAEAVPPQELAEAMGVEAGRISEALDRLEELHSISGSGLLLERIAGGVRLATRPEVGASVRRYFRHRNRTRLSPAALETLAIVAYRQPVTAPEIQAIRGKDPSSALKNLLDKKLVRLLGKKKVVGSPLLYGSTRQFLEHFGLNALDDLPSLEEFDGFVAALGGGWTIAEVDDEARPENGPERGMATVEATEVTPPASVPPTEALQSEADGGE